MEKNHFLENYKNLKTGLFFLHNKNTKWIFGNATLENGSWAPIQFIKIKELSNTTAAKKTAVLQNKMKSEKSLILSWHTVTQKTKARKLFDQKY